MLFKLNMTYITERRRKIDFIDFRDRNRESSW